MSCLPERSIATTHHEPTLDFMRRAYELNGEPLRLLDGGQRWFERVLSSESDTQRRSSALALGATPWLAQLLSRTFLRTTVVDASPAMLNLCAGSVGAHKPRPAAPVEFLRCNWLALPPAVGGLDVIAGDNAFSFLRFPDDWEQLLDILADRMTPNGVLFSRLLSVPAIHRRLSPAAIVEDALARHTLVNFTAVRVALLFAHWDSTDFTIRPEDALATFDAHRAEFAPLLCDVMDMAENDLLSIEKYRGTAATYFVPPIAEAIALFERHFHVRAVHFGPYDMSQYFPLIVASKAPV
jgi:hypothetical protein